MDLISGCGDLPVSTIYYDKVFNCRGEFTPQSCLDLAQSIQQHGLQFPIVVQPAEDVKGGIPEGYDYRLIVGHRRFTAIVQLLGQSIIAAQIRRGLSEYQAKILNLVENLERKNITLLDEAKAIHTMFPVGTTWKKMAKETSRSDFWCRIRWLIPTLSDGIQQDCSAGRLSATDIAIILATDNRNRSAMARDIKIARERGDSARVRRRKFSNIKKAKKRLAIHKMLANLMSQRIKPSPYRALAWAAGDLTDEEFLEEPDE